MAHTFTHPTVLCVLHHYFWKRQIQTQNAVLNNFFNQAKPSKSQSTTKHFWTIWGMLIIKSHKDLVFDMLSISLHKNFCSCFLLLPPHHITPDFMSTFQNVFFWIHPEIMAKNSHCCEHFRDFKVSRCANFKAKGKTDMHLSGIHIILSLAQICSSHPLSEEINTVYVNNETDFQRFF